MTLTLTSVAWALFLSASNFFFLSGFHFKLCRFQQFMLIYLQVHILETCLNGLDALGFVTYPLLPNNTAQAFLVSLFTLLSSLRAINNAEVEVSL